MLTGKGVAAWTRLISRQLGSAATAVARPQPAVAGCPAPATGELISILAAITLVPT